MDISVDLALYQVCTIMINLINMEISKQSAGNTFMVFLKDSLLLCVFTECKITTCAYILV